MKYTALLFLFCAAPIFATNKPQRGCTTKFAVIEKDALGNIQLGAQGKLLKWINDNLSKKYPDPCYTPSDHDASIIFVIYATPATYHGTRVVGTSSTTNGQIRDNDGDTATYEGTTDSSAVVPQTFEYSKYTLTVESVTADKKIEVRHRFQQDGIYSTYMGIPLGGRGHHPEQALIGDAIKWIQAGGLNDPSQGAQ